MHTPSITKVKSKRAERNDSVVEALALIGGDVI